MDPFVHQINNAKTLIDLALILIGIFAGYGRLRQEVLQDFQQKNVLLQDELRSVRSVCRMLERRLGRMEINDRRKTRQLAARTREIAYLEQVVRVAAASLASGDDSAAVRGEILEQVTTLTDELTSFRETERLSQQTWETEQSAAFARVERGLAVAREQDGRDG
jgi:hypothetical protein